MRPFRRHEKPERPDALARRRQILATIWRGVSIGEAREKFGACLGCMRLAREGHVPGCPLETPIPDGILP
jgi:hypothetical protein